MATRAVTTLGLLLTLMLMGCAAPSGTPESSATPRLSPSPEPSNEPSSEPSLSWTPQVVEWPEGSEFGLTNTGLGPLVLGQLIPTSEPSGTISECGHVAGVPQNVGVRLLDSGTVVSLLASERLGDPGEITVTAPHGLGIGASREEIVDAFGAEAAYREVSHETYAGEQEIEYRIDVALDGSLLVFTLGMRDQDEPALTADEMAVTSIRLALPGYEDPPWLCA